MTQIAGSTMLVTGAASGLGRLIARGAAEQGATLILWDIDGAGLEAVSRELNALGARVLTETVDLTDRPAVYAAASRAQSFAGAVEILVNNAGIVSGRLLHEIPDERIEATFAINTLALYWTTKALLPAMIAGRRGHIVTLASAAGLVGVARQTDYAASKHAAVGFDESLRYELRRTAPALRTTVICPFYVDTGMFRGVKSRFPWLLPILDPEKVAARVLQAIRREERRVVMPPIVRLLPALRLLPVPVFDRAIDFFGVNVGMDEFRGR